MDEVQETPLPEGFRPVVSSNIKGVMLTEAGKEDTASGTLEIIFKNNARWKYKNVPRLLFNEMLVAESIGKFYNANIKAGFEAEKVITETEAPK